MRTTHWLTMPDATGTRGVTCVDPEPNAGRARRVTIRVLDPGP